MFKKFIVIFTLVLCFPVFSETKAQTLLESDKIPANLIISFERTACLGSCPNYKLTINAKGIVKFLGRQYTDTKGLARGKIEKKQLEELLKEFEKANFFSFANHFRYGKGSCETVVTDMPSAIISIRVNKKRKRVFHYLGCFQNTKPPFKIFPEELLLLEYKIDEIVGTKRWIGERK
jgi:hypothetical protein